MCTALQFIRVSLRRGTFFSLHLFFYFYLCVWVPGRPEEGVRVPRAGVTGQLPMSVQGAKLQSSVRASDTLRPSL